MSTVLVIEDDAAMAVVVTTTLEGAGHHVETAASAELGLDLARSRVPELVLLDLHLPGRGGLDVLPELLALRPAPRVIVMTAHPTAENAIDAMARGASAHIEKPLDPDDLEAVVARVLSDVTAASPKRRGPASPDPPDDGSPKLVGRSRALLDLARRIGALARAEVPVLIRGESGTGKELVARALHERSPRRGGPFVAVSCAVLPEPLFEAELFGHERGAFTGADRARPGRVERAHGGTLFLDEVAELTPRSQAKLLRFLEERVYERVGGDAPRPADVRVLAATNAPLELRVERGEFREDLYYRLDVVTLEVPPLRARQDDLPLLIEHFVRRAGRADVSVDPAAIAAFSGRAWPGNIRELRNAVEGALVRVGPGTVLRADHLGPAPMRAQVVGRAPAPPTATAPGLSLSAGTSGPPPAPARRADPTTDLGAAIRALVQETLAQGTPADAAVFERVRAEVERVLIAAALEATGGNQVAAARLLDLNRATLRRKMAHFGLG